jgi:PST family polysaccharide transporter
MEYKFRNSVKSIANKNTVGAYLIQVDKALFVFFALPLLAYRLDFSAFGVFSFFLSLAVTVGLFVDWGLSLTSIRLLATAESYKKPIVVWEVIATRLLLFIFGAMFVGGLRFVLPAFSGLDLLYILVMVCLLSIALSPVFIFQADEKSFDIGLIYLIIRISTIFGYYYLIIDANDLKLAFGVYASSSIFAVIIGWMYYLRSNKMVFISTSLSKMIALISSGFNFAVASIASSFYGSGSVFILGLVTGGDKLGIFSLALAIARGLSSLFSPISQSVIPRFARLGDFSLADSNRLLRKMIQWQLNGSIILLLVCFFVVYIAPFFYTKLNIELISTLYILLPVVLATSLSSMLVLFVVIPRGLENFYKKLIISMGLIGVGLILLFGGLLGSNGAGASVLIIEVTIGILLYSRSMVEISKK